MTTTSAHNAASLVRNARVFGILRKGHQLPERANEKSGSNPWMLLNVYHPGHPFSLFNFMLTTSERCAGRVSLTAAMTGADRSLILYQTKPSQNMTGNAF